MPPTSLISEPEAKIGAADAAPRYSVVIPVFNSENVVGDTIDACHEFFSRRSMSFELVLVNDGSRDGSWPVLLSRARAYPEVTAINLLRNYGQHTAVLCGLQYSRGSWLITLDDDLQNPPAEIDRLIAAAEGGHDLVFGVPRHKRHTLFRRWGSAFVRQVNRRVFDMPPDVAPTNFRLMKREVADRILAHRTHAPYINGLALLYAFDPVSVPVEHEPRRTGRSNYGPLQIAEVVGRILFNYSSYPLRVVSVFGLVVAGFSFLLAAYFFLHGLLREPKVPGWSSVAVMLAFFNGVTLLLVGMLGEYTIRILRQISQDDPFHVVQVFRGES